MINVINLTGVLLRTIDTRPKMADTHPKMTVTHPKMIGIHPKMIVTQIKLRIVSTDSPLYLKIDMVEEVIDISQVKIQETTIWITLVMVTMTMTAIEVTLTTVSKGNKSTTKPHSWTGWTIIIPHKFHLAVCLHTLETSKLLSIIWCPSPISSFINVSFETFIEDDESSIVLSLHVSFRMFNVFEPRECIFGRFCVSC